MRIIDTDNFGGDYPDEKFLQVGDKPLTVPKDIANEVCSKLNAMGGNHSLRYYRMVPDDYVLQPGFEP
jgi:hypothetical protein